MKVVLYSGIAAAVLIGQLASAEAACNVPRWQFRWGPAPTSLTLNITEGSTCGSNVSLRGAEKLTGIGVLSNASNGMVRTTPNRFEYRPKANFKGSDSFAVELRGTDQWGQPVTNRLNVSVSVQ